ncbi:MAG: 30S ribosomal protein S2 [bacterium]
MPSSVTMKQLLEAGVHFGHQTRRWHPGMKPFIFQSRNGIYILDLQQTLKRIEEAHEFISSLSKGGGKILFLGTKKQASDAIMEEAQRCGTYYINQRWLGGLITNFQVLRTRIERLEELEAKEAAGDFEKLSKKEAKRVRTELNRLRKYLSGLRGMSELPRALFIVDLKKEYIAFLEAKKAKIPVVAVVDTNCDPAGVDYPIPGNDDAIRAVRLLCRVVADAVIEGRQEVEITEDTFAKSGETAAAGAPEEPRGDRPRMTGGRGAPPAAPPPERTRAATAQKLPTVRLEDEPGDTAGSETGHETSDENLDREIERREREIARD